MSFPLRRRRIRRRMSTTSTPRDPYDVLGVRRDASDQEIKKAFRKLARELHPDVNAHDPQAEDKFKEAAEAYEILSDSQRRATYDRYGHDGLRSAATRRTSTRSARLATCSRLSSARGLAVAAGRRQAETSPSPSRSTSSTRQAARPSRCATRPSRCASTAGATGLSQARQSRRVSAAAAAVSCRA